MRLPVASSTVPRIAPVAESWAASEDSIISKNIRTGRDRMRVDDMRLPLHARSLSREIGSEGRPDAR